MDEERDLKKILNYKPKGKLNVRDPDLPWKDQKTLPEDGKVSNFLIREDDDNDDLIV